MTSDGTKREEVVELDGHDMAKLENVLLRQELEKTRKELENSRRAQADKELNEVRADLQSYFIEKYDIDVNTSVFTINPQKGTLVISEK